MSISRTIRAATYLLAAAVFLVTMFMAAPRVKAADQKSADEKTAQKADSKDAKAESDESSSSASKKSEANEEKPAAKKPKFPPYAEFFKDADDPITGLIKLRRKGGTLYGELSPGQLNRDFIVTISIARGIGRGMLLAGMSWNFGDDWIWQFRKVDDYIQVVRRNVRFTAAKGSPEERAVELGLYRQRAVQLADCHDEPVGRLCGRSESTSS